MARIRTIKPEFFTSEDIGALSRAARLLYIGLWCHSDREGKMKYAPTSLAAQLMPYEFKEFPAAFEELLAAGHVQQYELEDKPYLILPAFLIHQRPHNTESDSSIPYPDGTMIIRGAMPTEKERMDIYKRDKFKCAYCQIDLTDHIRGRCLDHVIPFSMGGTNSDINLVTSCKKCNALKGDKIPIDADLPHPEGYGEKVEIDITQQGVNPPVNRVLTKGSGKGKGKGKDIGQNEFDRFWEIYPKKEKKKAAQKKWNTISPSPELTETIINAIITQKKTTWADREKKHIPAPDVWLNGERWNDEPIKGGEGTEGSLTQIGDTATWFCRECGEYHPYPSEDTLKQFKACWEKRPSS